MFSDKHTKSRNLVEIITYNRYLGEIFHNLAIKIRQKLGEFRYQDQIPFREFNRRGDSLGIINIENKENLVNLSFRQKQFLKLYKDLGSKDVCIRNPKIKCIKSKIKNSVNFNLIGGMSYIELYNFFRDLVEINSPPKSPDYDLNILSDEIVINKKRGKY